MIMLEEALAELLKRAPVCSTARRPLAECFQRVLAEDIKAEMDFPPFNRSPLDGYAVRTADIAAATPEHPVFLEQIDYVPAGTNPAKSVAAGQATRIMTGGKIPAGADAIVKLEDTVMNDGRIGILTPETAATNICSQGEEIRKGEWVLARGEQIQEGALSLLALLGCGMPLIHEKPQVGILATGSELLPVAEPLTAGKIHDSNSYMLMAKILQAGGEPVLLGTVPDELSVMAAALHAHSGLPLYITTGGASVGDYDLMERLFQHMGIPLLFKRVSMKPGMPVLAGVRNGSLFIALSGNPAAASVSFELLIRPLIRKIAGLKNWCHPRIKVKLQGSFTKPSLLRRFVWAHCFSRQGAVFAEPLPYQGNGMIRSSLAANALVEISAGSPPLESGTELEALLLCESILDEGVSNHEDSACYPSRGNDPRPGSD